MQRMDAPRTPPKELLIFASMHRMFEVLLQSTHNFRWGMSIERAANMPRMLSQIHPRTTFKSFILQEPEGLSLDVKLDCQSTHKYVYVTACEIVK